MSRHYSINACRCEAKPAVSIPECGNGTLRNRKGRQGTAAPLAFLTGDSAERTAAFHCTSPMRPSRLPRESISLSRHVADPPQFVLTRRSASRSVSASLPVRASKRGAEDAALCDSVDVNSFTRDAHSAVRIIFSRDAGIDCEASVTPLIRRRVGTCGRRADRRQTQPTRHNLPGDRRRIFSAAAVVRGCRRKRRAGGTQSVALLHQPAISRRCKC